MGRKSGRPDEENLLARAIASRPAAQAGAAGVLADLGAAPAPDPVPVEVSLDEYETWMGVELARSRGSADGKAFAAALLEEFGKDGVAQAIDIHGSVEERLRRAAAKAKRPAALTVAPSQAAFSLSLKGLATSRRPRLSVAEIAAYSAQRAVQFGFAPADVWAKGQGQRAVDRDSLKQARRLIVVELRDRGATFPDIGAVFGGRRKESVIALERAGRKELAERLARRDADYVRFVQGEEVSDG
jgi:hypothetical protein